jgi:uracil-DNA glycosylase
MTNAILCLKDGGMQAKVRHEWFANCGNRFLRPTIDLIAPKVVVTLGERAYCAVMAAYGTPQIPFRKAVERPDGFRLADRTTCVPVYHCGARILNTHRPYGRQVCDWKRVLAALDRAA